MARFSISPEEEEEGLVLEEVGMKLSAGTWLEEWLCREEGVSWDQEQSDRNFKLVLAEPLPGPGHLLHQELHHTRSPAAAAGAELRAYLQQRAQQLELRSNIFQFLLKPFL